MELNGIMRYCRKCNRQVIMQLLMLEYTVTQILFYVLAFMQTIYATPT